MMIGERIKERTRQLVDQFSRPTADDSRQFYPYIGERGERLRELAERCASMEAERDEAVELAARMRVTDASMIAASDSLYRHTSKRNRVLVAACRRALDYCEAGNVQDIRAADDKTPSLSEMLEDALNA